MTTEREPRVRDPLCFLYSLPLLFASSGLSAHHGFATHFDPDTPVRIEGTVQRFDFVNPHALLHIETTNEAGEAVVWICEMQSRGQLARKGVTQESFTPGEAIVVEGVAARRDPYRCEFGVSEDADGTRVVGRTLDQRRTVFELDLSAENPGTLTGNWIRKSFPGGGRVDPYQDSFTPEGAAAHAAYDEAFDMPVLRCSPSSPIKLWDQPGHPAEIRRDGERIIMRFEFMDALRVIHLDKTAHPSVLARRTLGHSIGWYEGETLVVETALFNAGVLFPHRGGILNSRELVLTERLTLNDEGDLEVEWRADDPVYFTAPVTGQQVMARTNATVSRYDCAQE